MDDMGTPGPNHPAHRGLRPNNVAQLPGMKLRRLRVFKNTLKDHLIGSEQVIYKDHNEYEGDPFVTQMAPEKASALDEHINNAIANSGQSTALNQELGRTNNLHTGMQEGKVISMGKFKEDRANKALMEGTE